MLKPVLTKAFLQPAKAAAMCMTCLTRVRVREGLDRGLGLNSGLACHFSLNFQARISALLPTFNPLYTEFHFLEVLLWVKGLKSLTGS